jgi:hypothetical protein
MEMRRNGGFRVILLGWMNKRDLVVMCMVRIPV